MGCGASKSTDVQKRRDLKSVNLPGCFLATYKLQPKYEFSERHAVYVDDIKKVEGLPPPQPSHTSKEDIFDIKSYRDMDKRADKAPVKLLKEPYGNLVNYLTQPAKSEMGRMRAIYRWITAQRLDKISVPDVMPSANTPLHQIWRIKNRKGNYAQLVSILCRMANIPCVIIHGVLKGSTYDVGQKLDEKAHYGEWNAVLINHQWRLLNAYWGACAIGSEGGDDWMEIDDGGEDETEQQLDTKGEKEYVYVCDENYFLTDPRQLISTHFPIAREWQLLNEPVTMTQFERMAFLKDRFFNLGMSVVSHPECVVHSQSGEVELAFGLPEEEACFLKFYYLLFRQETQSDQSTKTPTYDRYVFMHRPNKTELSVRIRSPIAGIFRLELVGRDVRVDDPTYDYDWVVLYKIRFHKAKHKCMPYPDMPTLGWGPTSHTVDLGLKTLTHHTGEIRATQRGDTEIAFEIVDDIQLAKPSFIGKLKKPGMKDDQLKDRLIHRVEGGKVIFNVKLPKRGEYALSLNGLSKKGKGKSKNFANYMVVSDQKQYLEPFPPGFDQGIGQKPACEKFGLIPVSHPGGLIYSDNEEVELIFKKTQPVDVSISVIGSEVVVSDSRRLVMETVDDDMITFTVHLPRRGSYGVRIIGKSDSSPTFENVFDYIIEFMCPVHMMDIRVEPEGQEVLRPLRNKHAPKAPTPSIASSLGEGQPKPGKRKRGGRRQRANAERRRAELQAELDKSVLQTPHKSTADHDSTKDHAKDDKQEEIPAPAEGKPSNGDHPPSTDDPPTKDHSLPNDNPSSNDIPGDVPAPENNDPASDYKPSTKDKPVPIDNDSPIPTYDDDNSSSGSPFPEYSPLPDCTSINEFKEHPSVKDIFSTNTPLNDSIFPDFPDGVSVEMAQQGLLPCSVEYYQIEKSRQARESVIDEPSSESSDGEYTRDAKEDEIRRRVDVAIEAEDDYELTQASQELQQLGTERAISEKARVDHELSILLMKRDLQTAERERDLKSLNHLISLCKERGYDKRLPQEMRHARHIQERLQLLEKLKHEVSNLNQQTIMEIRHYSHPPPVVHSVMMATLLLLGHFDEETQDWSRVLVIIGKTGREALKRRCEKFDMDHVELDVALGARQLLKDITLEQVRKLSVAAATFYVWTKGMVEELEARYGEKLKAGRPRTSHSARGGRHKSKQEGLEHL